LGMMKYETLIGIAKTASAMDISVTLEIEGLLFNLTRGRHTVTGLVPWHLLEEARDPHGLCACTMGDIFKAIDVAQGVDEPRVIKPSHWNERAGKGDL